MANSWGNGMMMRRKRNVENMLHLFNLCALLFLFSHSSSFPFTLQTLSHLYHHNSFYAFLLLNAIILFLFALSNKHNNNNVAVSTHEILNHFDYSRLHVQQSRTVDSEPLQDSTSSRVFEETVSVVTQTTMERETVSVSESFERRMVVAPPRRELNRRLRCVEQLSEDEFNRAVEDFIALHKRMQWEERIGSSRWCLSCTPPNYN